MEPAISAELVRRMASDAAVVIDAMNGQTEAWLARFSVRIEDGNRLTGTEHRLNELRFTKPVALPGQSLRISQRPAD